MTTEEKRLLAKVHVAKKQLALDDGTYRDVLERVTGQRSAKGLDRHQLVRVLDAFRQSGWKDSGNSVNAAQTPKSAKPHVRKIWALWTAMCKSGYVDAADTRAALRAFVEKRTSVTDPEWLTPEQATTVIESLKQWQRREAAAAKRKPKPDEGNA